MGLAVGRGVHDGDLVGVNVSLAVVVMDGVAVAECVSRDVRLGLTLRVRDGRLVAVSVALELGVLVGHPEEVGVGVLDVAPVGIQDGLAVVVMDGVPVVEGVGLVPEVNDADIVGVIAELELSVLVNDAVVPGESVLEHVPEGVHDDVAGIVYEGV